MIAYIIYIVTVPSNRYRWCYDSTTIIRIYDQFTTDDYSHDIQSPSARSISAWTEPWTFFAIYWFFAVCRADNTQPFASILQVFKDCNNDVYRFSPQNSSHALVHRLDGPDFRETTTPLPSGSELYHIGSGKGILEVFYRRYSHQSSQIMPTNDRLQLRGGRYLDIDLCLPGACAIDFQHLCGEPRYGILI